MSFYKKHEDVMKELNVTRDGLSSLDAKERLLKDGLNEITGEKKRSIIAMFFQQLKSPLVLVLLVAAIISVVLAIIEKEGYIDGIVIMSIVILNCVLGVVQEKKAEDSIDALKKMSSPTAKVIRNGDIEVVDAKQLVVGDIVTLDTGDFVPADMRLIESANLQVDESALTGESVSSDKNYNIVFDENTPLADRKNTLFMSTYVTYGRGVGVVTGTAFNTEIGKIAKFLTEHKKESTPLEKKIAGFAKILTIACVLIVIAFMFIGLAKGQEFQDVLLLSISLAVAGIPEGLPAVVTVVLAMGMRRMAKKNAIIKNLPDVETLGSTTVICSDKTGTLTQNRMFVSYVNDLSDELTFDGTGYLYDGGITNQKSDKISKNFEHMFLDMALCNDSEVIENENKIIGDPTEGALRVAAYKAGYGYEELETKYSRVDEMPFDSERKLMSVLVAKEGKYVLYTKGATDSLLNRVTKLLVNGKEIDITEQDKKKILEINDNYSAKALRVLGYAYKTQNTKGVKEEGLTFVGLSAMIDPPRQEVKDAILRCNKAGIRVVMITGDHKVTAKAIGTKLGICDEDSRAYSGVELDKLSENELLELGKDVNVFARVSPENKVQIVNAIKVNNNIVCMTGDGVNDAPALKNADIGVAMGITGTDVAKQAANMILTDDNFTSIVAAVEEGRVIYSNIKKFINFLISCNIGEVLIVTLATIFSGFFGGVQPLLAMQLLWINLMTDSLPAFALGLEKAEDDAMLQPPQDPMAPLADKTFFVAASFQALGLVVAILIVFKIGLNMYTPEIANTMAFMTIVLGELLRAYSARSQTRSIFSFNPLSNAFMNKSVLISVVLLVGLVYIPGINDLFYLTPVSIGIVGICIMFALIPSIFAEVSKIYLRKIEKDKTSLLNNKE